MDAIADSDRPLYDAVWKDDFERVKGLVEKGVPVDGVVFGGETFLMIACEKKNKAIVDLLLKRGVEVNKTTGRGITALMLAAEPGDEEIFDLLTKHNADVMMKDWRGWTVFHFAAWYNSKSILDRLLLMGRQQCCSASGSPSPRGTNCGSTVDIEDDSGRTPLWWAACHGHVDCVDVLLVHGANPDHKSKWQGSPLDIAKREGHTAIVSMMTGALESDSNSLVVNNHRVITELKEEICMYEENVLLLNSRLCERDEKIQSLEKDKDESDQKHRREIAGLREKLHASDEKIKELESRIKQDCSTCDPGELFQAVILHGREQWYSLCVEMGYSRAAVVAITTGITSEADKIRAVFDNKLRAVGKRAATQALLKACRSIPDPIIGGVMDSLSK